MAAERRIGFYLGQDLGDPQWDNLHENGIALLDAAVDYALGLLQPPALQAEDADQVLDFDQLDLVLGGARYRCAIEAVKKRKFRANAEVLRGYWPDSGHISTDMSASGLKTESVSVKTESVIGI